MTNRWTTAALWLFLYGSFALLSPPLLDGADALHAEIAREMLVRGDPVTLYANGTRILHDAPLLYWSMAGSMHVFGVGAPQARLPLAVYVLLLALLVEAFARAAFRNCRAGLYAAGSLLLSPVLFFSTRVLGAGAISSLWFTAAVFCLWQAESAPQERSGEAPVLPCLGFAAACALNVLTVGPGGLLLPVGTALLYLLLTRGARGAMRRIGGLHPALAAFVFLLIALPWHVFAAEARPPRDYAPKLWSISFLHGWDAGSAASPSLWLAGLLPWCVFLPRALGGVPWRKPFRILSEQQRLLLLLALAGLVPVVCCIFPSGPVSCPVLTVPFVCMLVAQWLGREAAESDAMTVPARLGHAGLRTSAGLMVAGIAAALGCAALLLRSAPPSPHAELAALLHHAPDTPWWPVHHLPDAAALGFFRGPLLIAGVAIFVGTLLGWHLRRSYRPHFGNLALAAATLVCLTEAHVSLNTVAPVLSSQPLAANIAPVLRTGNRIVMNGPYQGAATLGFYLQRDNIHTLQPFHDRAEASLYPDASATLETVDSLRQQWTGPERIFLWTDPAKLPALPSKAFIVAEGGGKQIVSNKAGPY